MEKYVCNLGLAQRLKELGCKQESEFYWVNGRVGYGYEGETEIDIFDKDEWDLLDHIPHYMDFRVGWNNEESDDKNLKRIEKKQKELLKKTCSAFTVGELGEMLGALFMEDKIAELGYQIKHPKVKDCRDNYIPICDIVEANARAKMLIYLLENKLIKGDQS